MRTVTTDVYPYSELAPEVQLTVLENYADVNVMEGWEQDLFQEAATVGVTLTGYNEGLSVVGSLTSPYDEVANQLMANYPSNPIYSTCEAFLQAYNTLLRYHNNDPLEPGEFTVLQDAFSVDVLAFFTGKLRNEYDYRLTSTQVILTLSDPSYEFTIDGILFNF